MKKNYILLFAFSFLIESTSAQDNALSFDGANDYVDLGSTVGNNIRTFQCWFQPNQEINGNLSDYQTLIGRDAGLGGSTTDHFEFALMFRPSFVSNSGKLNFYIFDCCGSRHNVFSDSNRWLANQWHHVAAVIDPIKGMKLYIDGIAQSDTNTYFVDTDSINFITAIGRLGFFSSSRYFNGRIDNVEFYSDAVYSSNFTPYCNGTKPISSSPKAAWYFEETSGNVVIDSSGNGYHSIMNGPNRVLSTSVCNNFTVGLEESFKQIKENKLTVYPNPVSTSLSIQFEKDDNYFIEIFNSNGQKIFEKRTITNLTKINSTSFSNGIYYYHINSDNNGRFSGKFIKK